MRRPAWPRLHVSGFGWRHLTGPARRSAGMSLMIVAAVVQVTGSLCALYIGVCGYEVQPL
jgi:hypothetical protein